MEIVLVLLLFFGMFLLLTPYALTRLVLHATLACYKDKTSAEAAGGVKMAGFACFALGALMAMACFSGLGGLNGASGSSGFFMLVFIVVPLVSQWAAIATPLRVKVKVPAPAPVEQPEHSGFTSFEL
jgi:hypothetical protein